MNDSRIFYSRDGTEWRNATGQLHREDGPALMYWNGDVEWWRNGRVHREDGPAVILADTSRGWYQDGELHREDGPAIERHDGVQIWCRNGEIHREDGPAIVRPDGDHEWYLGGEKYDEATYLSNGGKPWINPIDVLVFDGNWPPRRVPRSPAV